MEWSEIFFSLRPQTDRFVLRSAPSLNRLAPLSSTLRSESLVLSANICPTSYLKFNLISANSGKYGIIYITGETHNMLATIILFCLIIFYDCINVCGNYAYEINWIIQLYIVSINFYICNICTYYVVNDIINLNIWCIIIFYFFLIIEEGSKNIWADLSSVLFIKIMPGKDFFSKSLKNIANHFINIE